jgi:hypothetical protein
MLRAAWISGDPDNEGLTGADVQSTLPGSVFYAEQPAIGSYWALSRFVPTPEASSHASTPQGQVILARFIDIAIFAKAAGQKWSYRGDFVAGSCPTSLPTPVIAVWGLCKARS